MMIKPNKNYGHKQDFNFFNKRTFSYPGIWGDAIWGQDCCMWISSRKFLNKKPHSSKK